MLSDPPLVLLFVELLLLLFELLLPYDDMVCPSNILKTSPPAGPWSDIKFVVSELY